MRKSLEIIYSFLFILSSFLFTVISDKKFLLFLPILIAIYFMEGKIKQRFLIKLIEATPLILFILLIASGINLFYVLSILLLLLISAKFVLVKEKKDYYEIFLIGSLMILLSSVSTISLSFALLLILFLYTGTMMLIFSQIKEKNIKPSGQFHLAIVVFVIISFVFSFALFFSFPRLSIGYFHGINLKPTKESGFSENVTIEKGNVNLNNAVVMRIESNKNISPLYISGLHFATFNGKSWQREIGKIRIFSFDGSNDFGIINGMEKFTVYLEPTGTSVLFGPDKFFGIHGEFIYLKRNKFGDFFTDNIYYKTIKYDAFSSIPGISRINLVKITTDKNLEKYLQLPPLPEKFKEIAKNVAKGTTILEKAESIENFLKQNYKYSLNPTANSITDFILNRKSGYCEHFATAFILFARENGIPARLVSGFVTREYNPDGKYFIVREKDAHAWAEIYIKDKGWIRFDPTPPASVPKVSKISLIMDSIKMSWYRNVITYDSAKQISALKSMQKGITSIGTGINALFGILQKIVRKWRIWIILLSIILLIYVWMKKERYVSKTDVGYIISKSIGTDKKPNETLIEYAKRKGVFKKIKYLIYRYYEVRFSSNYSYRNELKRIIKEIKEQTKSKF